MNSQLFRKRFTQYFRIILLIIFLFSLWGLSPDSFVWAKSDNSNNSNSSLEAPADTTETFTPSADTYIVSGDVSSENNYGGAADVQNNPYSLEGSETDQFKGSLLRWDLSTIDSNATVTAASITFYVTDTSVFAFDLYALLHSFTEGINIDTNGTGASWSYSDAGITPWITPGAQGIDSDRGSINLWNATGASFGSIGSTTISLNSSGIALVQNWISNSANNYGVTIQNYSGTSSDYWSFASKENSSGYDPATLSVTYTLPVITTTGTLLPFSAKVGAISPEQSFSVSGADLTGDITISVPSTKFEVSTTSGSGFGTSVTLTPTYGEVASTTIYVRFSSTSAGTFDGDISLTSAGATTKYVAVSGTANANTAPSNPVLVEPSNGATDVSTSPTLSVAVSDPESDTLTVMFYGRKAPSAFVLIDTDTNVTSGTNASITWPGLLNSKEYDWYVVADDGNLTTTSSTWSFTTEAPVNNPPVITQGLTTTLTLSEDASATPLNLDATDADDDTLTWSISAQASKGVAAVPSPGTGNSIAITYTPNANANGSDSFVVEVSDGKGGTDTITVEVTINPVNDSPVITQGSSTTLTTTEDTSNTKILDATDIDSTTLTWSIYSQGSKGTASLPTEKTGLEMTVTYTPDANNNGSDSFVVQVSDGNGGTAQITVNVTINAVNDAPVITQSDPASIHTIEDTAASNLPLSATDVDGDTLNWSILSAATKGTAAVVAPVTGTSVSISYTPNANANGSDSFVVQVSDGAGGTDTITVNVTIDAVNDAPVITQSDPASIHTSEDASASTLPLSATDVEGNTLTWSILTAATKGTATVVAPVTGNSVSISYIPNANANGSDTFVVQVSDGVGGTDSITVNVTIDAVNDAPVITQSDPASIHTSEDATASTLPLSATDVDGNTLTWSILTAATKGTASVAIPNTGNSNTVSYTPNANANGSDSFVVRVSDGNGGTDTITVNVTIDAVNDAPVITQSDPASIHTTEDATASTLPLSATDVEGNTLTWSILTAATKGSASVAIPNTGNSNTVSYTPNANLNGSDSFVVQVSDGNGGTDTITVNVTIDAANDAPVITQSDPASIHTSEDAAASTLPLSATDIEGNTLTWSILTAATKGTADVAVPNTGTDMTISYTPGANSNGSDSFVVQVSDGNGGSDSITVNVTIDPVNDAPIITEGDSVPVAMSKNGAPNPFSLTLHATDIDSATLTWSISSQATDGTASISSPATGISMMISYVPNIDYVGADSFTVQVADGSGGTDSITVNVSISAVSYLLTINRSGTANVTITSNPAGINCGNSTTACSASFEYGTPVTLTATPATNYYRLASWSDNTCTSNTTCVETITEEKAVTAYIETATFSDVPFTHPRWAYIQALYNAGYTAGCQKTGDPLAFCPNQVMMRDESAVFMLRAIKGVGYNPGTAKGTVFTDMTDITNWATRWAEAMYAEGMTAGCQYPANSALKFCQYTNFTRDMGAVFGLRIKNGISYNPPAATGTVFFDMTDTTLWSTKWAEQSYLQGLLEPCSTGNFCPTANLDRSWTAYMIVKAKGLTLPE